MIECVAMKNIVILIHKKRDDILKLSETFPNSYIYIDSEIDFDSATTIVKIEHSSKNIKNVIGNGIRHIHKNLPKHHILLINEHTTIEEIKSIKNELIKGDNIIIASNENILQLEKRQIKNLKIITKLFNLVHKQRVDNLISNVQGIPADKVKFFCKLKGDSCTTFINEHFIIKDQKFNIQDVSIESNVSTDAPKTLKELLQYSLMICFVFIKFVLASASSFLLDYSLSLAGYSFWSMPIVAFLGSLSFAVPAFLLDIEIVPTLIARIISSVYNYNVNNKLVFAAKNNMSKLSTSCKYFTLVLFIWVFNTIILKMVTSYIGIPFAYAKLIADAIMYFVSFTVQRDLIFKKNSK